MQFPYGLDVDSIGNIFFADDNNLRVRRIDTFGVITTIAGNGVSGISGDGGPATAAELGGPICVKVSNYGIFIVDDAFSYRIRRIPGMAPISNIYGISSICAGGTTTLSDTTAGGSWSSSNTLIANVGSGTGVVTGVSAGTATISYTLSTGCTSSTAVTVNPMPGPITGTGITTSTGIISTVAGNGTWGYSGDGGSATSAELRDPGSVAVDGSGNIYITDDHNNRIRVVNSAGIITTFAGNGTAGYSGDGGQATAAELNTPNGIAIDGYGNVYITDAINQRIRKINSSGIISTIAGTGTAGYSGDGGPATAAELFSPWGISVDGTGNVYIADAGNNRIRKVNTSGVISTFAGNGTAGYSGDGGQATAAEIKTARGVAVDGSGNVYIADLLNERIRKVNSSGIISTFAGNGTAGHTGDGGAATSAELYSPWNVSIDGTGNVYIADYYYGYIRKINTSGIISTVAGNGTSGYSGDGGLATAAGLQTPTGLAVDGSGNIYIADYSNVRVREVTAQMVVCSGATITLSNTVSGGVWSSSNPSIGSIGSSTGILTGVSAGTATISYVLTGGCAVTTTITVNPTPAIIGTSSICTGSGITLVPTPTGGTWSASNGHASVGPGSGIVTGLTAGLDTISYTLSSGCSASKVITVNPLPLPIAGGSPIISTIAGNGTDGFSGDGGPGTAAQLHYIYGVAADGSGNTYIVDNENNRIRKVNSAGVISTFAGSGTAGFSGDGGAATAATLNHPMGVSVDGSGNLYIADGNNQRIRKVNPSGVISTIAGSATTGGFSGDGGAATLAQLNAPNGVAIDASGNIYIADESNNRIRKVSTSGIINTIAGNGTGGYGGDGGAATSAALYYPQGVAVDGSGNVYIADWFNHRIRVVNSAGVIKTFAGNGTAGYSGDTSPATSATLNYPSGVAVDPAGNVYIADYSNNRIRKVGTTGIIFTYSGNGLPAFSGDGGPANAAQVFEPWGVAVDPYSNLYIADWGNRRVRAVLPGTTDAVCVGSTIVLSDVTPGGIWTGSNIHATVTSTGIVIGVTPGLDTVVYTLPTGCSVTKVVVVNANPTIGTSVPIPPCAGSAITLTASGGTTYTWSPGTGLSATTGATVVATLGSTTTYSVTGATGGCSTTAVITVSVVSVPAISAGAGVAICTGTSATLTASGGTTYTWSPGAGLSVTTGATVTATPTGTTTYTITGTTTGCSGTAITTVTVNGLPVISAGAGVAICTGSSTTLTAIGGTIYTWSPGTGLSATTGATVTANPTGTTTYTITGTTAGCSGTATTTVTVNGLPVISAGADITICSGSSTTLTATGGTNYTWSPGTGLSATTGATVTASPGVTTTYTVTGTTAGCSNTATKTVMIGSSLSISAGAGVAICTGSSTTLTATGGTTYTWSPGTGLSATTGATVTANPIGTITYTITGTTGGCSGAATTTVTVNGLPVISAGAGVAICAGSSSLLTATGGTTYSWSPSTGLSANTGATVTASPTVTTTYTVTGTTAGCSGAATKTVTVNAVSGISAGPGVTICSGSATTLTAIGGTTYTWSPSTGLSATTGASVTASPTATITYTVTETSGGCSGAATKTVTVTPMPSVITGPSSLCVGAIVTESDLPGGGVWSASGTVVVIDSVTGIVTGMSGSISIITYTIGAAGSFAGCSATKTITVNSVPAITGPSSVCVGGTITLFSGPSGTWTSGNIAVATTGSGSGVVTGVAMGTAVITFTGTTGCFATKVITVNAGPTAITGSNTVCAGSSITLADSIGGGVWSTASTNVTLGTSTGNVAGVTAGPATISYSIGTGCSVSKVVTVNPIPSPITGVLAVCAGTSAVFSDPVTGGVWSSSPTTTAIISLFSGIATGITAGTATITYMLPSTGCSITRMLTVNAVPAAITGVFVLCAGNSTTLSDATIGGTWSSGSSGIAAIGSGSGVVTGVAAGIATVTYTSGVGCIAVHSVTVNPGPPGITGSPSVCIGHTTTLSDASPGGTWTSSNIAVATAGSGTGVVTGIAGGSATITYTLLSGCYVTYGISVSTVPAITGLMTKCAWGDTFTVYDSNPTGSYSSTVATVLNLGGGAGRITTFAPGTSTVTYTLPTGCYVTASFTVNPLPGQITGSMNVCQGATTTLSNSLSGGVWSSGLPAIATVGTGSGIVTGVSAGTTYITYTLANGCKADTPVHVNPGPAMIIGYPTMVVGTTGIYSDTTAGGLWSSSNTAIATIGAGTGIAHAVSAGVVTLTYTAVTGCFITKVVTVNPATGVSPEETDGIYITGGTIRVIPNPNKGEFTIQGRLGNGEEEVTIEITDIMGRMVYRNKIITESGMIEEQILLGDKLANGMYLLSVRSGLVSQVMHVVVSR